MKCMQHVETNAAIENACYSNIVYRCARSLCTGMHAGTYNCSLTELNIKSADLLIIFIHYYKMAYKSAVAVAVATLHTHIALNVYFIYE